MTQGGDVYLLNNIWKLVQSSQDEASRRDQVFGNQALLSGRRERNREREMNESDSLSGEREESGYRKRGDSGGW